MQLVNRSTIDRAASATSISASNRSIYRRLKVSLSLNLRRQIFLAVCDDLTTRNWLAARLHAELVYPQSRLDHRSNNHRPANGTATSSEGLGYPHLVSLWLNLQDPDPLVQVSHWLSQHPLPQNSGRTPGFQMIGVEHLTRQPPSAQQLFLTHLQQSNQAIQSLDSTLVLWLTRPWLFAVQQSAPALWNCHTALFEFEGEPLNAPAEEQPDRAIPTQLQSCHKSPEPVPDLSPWRVSLQENLVKTLLTTTDTDWQSVSETKELEGIPPLDAAQNSKNLSPGESAPEAPIASDPAIEGAEAIVLPAIEAEFLVAHPDVAEMVQQIEQLHGLELHEFDPGALASAYQKLGNLLRDRIEQGDTAEQILALAIQAYEQTLVWSDEAAPGWADGLNDIGNLYWMLARQSSQAELRLPYLEQAIVAYQFAIAKSDPHSRPRPYALIQSNLGSVYGDLAQYRDQARSLQQSALAYEESLRYRSLEDDPARFAATQNNLGTTYWNLAQHQQPVHYLQQAIVAYQQSLRCYSPACEPLHYAMLQNNLGTAFWNLAQHSPESQQAAIDWLLQSTRAYQEALVYRTLDASPPAYAATQNNLGTAFWNLATSAETQPGDRRSYLNQAIVAYTACLTAIQTLQSAPSFDPLTAHNHLGLAYYHRANDPQIPLEAVQRSTDLESALHHHLQSLVGWQQDPDLRPVALQAIVQTIKAFYTQFGLKGQNLALSKVPATLLPELMRRL